MTLFVTFLYYPACTIEVVAYGQFLISTSLFGLYWLYTFICNLRKRPNCLKINCFTIMIPCLHCHSILYWISCPKKLMARYKDLCHRINNMQILFVACFYWVEYGFNYLGLLQPIIYIYSTSCNFNVQFLSICIYIYVFIFYFCRDYTPWRFLSIFSFAEQGVYDVVNNLGSVPVRSLLLPIEESSYFYFAQMLNRSVSIEKQPRKEVEQIVTVLRRLLRALSLFGATVAVFGYSYLLVILYLNGGRTLTEGPILLKTHWPRVEQVQLAHGLPFNHILWYVLAFQPPARQHRFHFGQLRQYGPLHWLQVA